MFRPYVRNEPYEETGTNSKRAFDEATNRECVAYATGDGLWKKDVHINWQTWRISAKDFKYTWKPVDCNLKAPFLCQNNPGEKPIRALDECVTRNKILNSFLLLYHFLKFPFQIFLVFTKYRM